MSTLDEIKARAEKASEARLKYNDSEDEAQDGALSIRAAFIAEQSSYDVPPLIAALAAVEALHRKVPVYVTEAGDCKHGGDCESVEIDGESMCPDGTEGYTCTHCAELNTEECPDYPCTTVRAIKEALQ